MVHIVGELGDLIRIGDAGEIVALGDEPGLAAEILRELRADDRKLGARLDIVEPEEDLAFLDLVALADRYRLDDASVAMLHLLQVLVDLDHALRDHGAVQRRGGGPAAATEHEQQGERRAGDDMAAQAEVHAAPPLPLAGCVADSGEIVVMGVHRHGPRADRSTRPALLPQT